MRNTLALIISILISGNLSAQSDFRPGYIITNSSDTINGLISYKANAQKCVFKTGVNGEEMDYAPNDLLAYRITDNKFYIKKVVDVEGTKTPVFFEYLVNGIIDIYYYRNVDGEHYYVEDEEGTLILLNNDEQEVFKSDTKYTIKSNEYKHQLKMVFYKSPNTIDKVDGLSLNHKSLINLASDYHQEVFSDEECIVYEKKGPREWGSFGIFFEAVYNTFAVSKGFDVFPSNTKFNASFSPSIGFFYKKKLAFIDEHLFIQYEFSYNKFNVDGVHNEDQGTLYRITTFEYSTSSLNNLIQIRWEFQAGKIKPTIQIGGFLNFNITPSASTDLDVFFQNGEIYYSVHSDNVFFESSIHGISLGAGVHGKVFKNRDAFLDLRYQRGGGLAPGLSVNFFEINLGVQLGGSLNNR